MLLLPHRVCHGCTFPSEVRSRCQRGGTWTVALYLGFMCPLLLISPAKQLLIPQVPLRSVPGSSGHLTSLSQQERIVECTMSRRGEFSLQTFVSCYRVICCEKRPNLIFPLAEVTFGKEQWELAQQTPGSFSKISGPKQEIRDQLYLDKPHISSTYTLNVAL